MSTEIEIFRQRVIAARNNPRPLGRVQRKQAERHAYARAHGWPLSELVVTRTGEIRTFQEVGGNGYGISRVTPEVFSGAVDEVAWAERHLPIGSDHVEVGGVRGWVYDVHTNLGYDFTFFMYWDRFERVYRVRLVAPRLDLLGLVHATHLYSDGHLCLNASTSGERMFNNAFAKSALWADGISQMLEGHAWPWGE